MPPRALCVALVASALGCPTPLWGGEWPVASQPHSLAQAVQSHPRVGERLSFQGRWLGLPVGHGWIEVKGIVELDGRRAYHIEAQGHSNRILSTFYPIHDVLHSYLDAETLQPLRFEKQQREGDYRAEEVVAFDHAAGIAAYRSLLNQSVKEIPIPPDVQDLISALYWFRRQPLRPDGMRTLHLYTDEKVYLTDLRIGPPFLLELLKRGTFQCVEVEPLASFKGVLVRRGRLWAYFTTGAHRLPVLVKAATPWGPMTAVLDEASIPADVLGAYARGDSAGP